MSVQRYQEMINAEIGPAWLKFLSQRTDPFGVGKVRVCFEITADGEVVNSRVKSNTGNDELGQVALAAIKSVRFPPIPPEVLNELPGQRFAADYGFTVIQNHRLMSSAE